MSLITIRTSSTRVDAYLSGIFAMAESALSKDDKIDSQEDIAQLRANVNLEKQNDKRNT